MVREPLRRATAGCAIGDTTLSVESPSLPGDGDLMAIEAALRDYGFPAEDGLAARLLDGWEPGTSTLPLTLTSRAGAEVPVSVERRRDTEGRSVRLYVRWSAHGAELVLSVLLSSLRSRDMPWVAAHGIQEVLRTTLIPRDVVLSGRYHTAVGRAVWIDSVDAHPPDNPSGVARAVLMTFIRVLASDVESAES